MTAIPARLRPLLSALLLPVLLPLHLGMPYLHLRLGRLGGPPPARGPGGGNQQKPPAQNRVGDHARA
ncbi:hypothetical protein, partial [Kitasatospora sp. NPDC059571]|uniref:hypothetical protein n=1 Tax=Kitasatospora sp. NPDC059571 TaxID=3346871 RepID=UPI00368F9B92